MDTIQEKAVTGTTAKKCNTYDNGIVHHSLQIVKSRDPINTNAIQQFKDAIRAASLTPPPIIKADGILKRFSSNGKRGDFYVLKGTAFSATPH